MESNQFETKQQEAYLFLGKFVVCFSGLLYALVNSTITLQEPLNDLKKIMKKKAKLGKETAKPLAELFFTTFTAKWAASMTIEDSHVISVLAIETKVLIEQRNRLMHDVWMTTSRADNDDYDASTLRVKSNPEDTEFEVVNRTINDIVNLIEHTRRLTHIINGLVWYCIPGVTNPNVSSRFEVIDGAVFSKRDC